MVVSVLDGGAGAGLVLVRELRVGDRAAQEVAEPGPALAHPVRKAVNEMSRKLSQNSSRDTCFLKVFTNAIDSLVSIDY